MVNKIKYCPICILGFSGIFGTSKGLILSFLVFIFYYFLHKPNLLLFRENNVKWTGITFLLTLLTFSLSIFLSDPHNDYKFVIHFVEMAIPFLLFILYCYDDFNKCLLFAWRGICLGTFLHGICVVFIKISGMVRPYNWVGIANDIGGMFAMILFIVIAGLYYYWHSKYDRILGCGSFIIGMLALIASYSRGAIGSFVVSFCLISVIGVIFDIFKFNKKVIIGGLMIGLFLILGNLLFGQNLFQARNYDNERVGMRISSMRMFADNPISGIGFGNFNSKFKNNYKNEYSKHYTFTHPHNIYCHYLSQGGIVGTIGVASMVFAQIYLLLKEFIDKKNEKRTRIMALCTLGVFLSILVHGWVDVNFERRNYKRLFWVIWGFYCLAVYCDQKKHLSENGKNNA